MKKLFIILITSILVCLFPISCFAADSKTTDLIYIQKAKVLFIDNLSGITYDYSEYKVGEKINEPTHGTVRGYTFGGWYTDEECTQAWNFKADKVTGNITLYAKWIANNIPQKAISGNVTETSTPKPVPVPNATVELFLGTIKVAATVTDASGNYSFDNVENGIYNIVVITEDGKTKTELVTVDTNGDFKVDVKLPSKDVSSVVEVTSAPSEEVKSDISKTVVGGLDKIAENSSVGNGEKVTIKLTVVPKNESDVTSAGEIKTAAGSGKKVEFLDLSLWKLINNDEVNKEPIGADNTQLLTIVIPFDFKGVDVTSVKIIRNHKGVTSTLGDASQKNVYGEYVEINSEAGNITLYAMKFSDYALAYKEQTHSGGGGSSTKPTPVVPETGYTKCTKDSTCPLYKFKDLKTTDWYHDGIHFCLDEGLMKGISATKFDQAGNTSRAMMMTIIARMGGAKCDSVGPNWYLDGVNYVKANKISDGSRPTDMITREEFAVMLYNFAKTQGKGFKGDWVFPLDFKDANKVSGDAHEAMCWCVKNKILNGRGGIYAGKLDPKGRLTRAEASAMIQRYYEVK